MRGRNVIIFIIIIEVILLACALLFLICVGSQKVKIFGMPYVYATVVLIVAAAESAVGLSIVAYLYKKTGSIGVHRKVNLRFGLDCVLLGHSVLSYGNIIGLVASAMKCLVVILSAIIAVAFFTLLERKILAAIQRRSGPNMVGL